MLLSKKTSIKVSREYANLIGHMCYAASKLWNVCNYERQHYKEIGTIVYLHASFEVINSRLKNAKKRGVALRDGQTLKDLYDERVVLFEKYADITVSEDIL